MHKRYTQHCKDRIQPINQDERYSVTEFVNIPTEKFDEVKKLTDDFLDSLSHLSDSKIADQSVLGICMHLNNYKIKD